jgi:hypothetical protein
MLADAQLAQEVGHVGGHLLNHWQDVLAGATFIGIVAHAVNSFPTPTNVYGQWVLGIIKYAVGQRISAANALAGLQTETTAVTTAQKAALALGSTMEVVKTPDGMLKPIDGATLPDGTHIEPTKLKDGK